MTTKSNLFFVCRVLATKPDRRDYVMLQGEELARRHDVEVASKGFVTEAAAPAETKRLRGSIPDGFDLLLDFWTRTAKRFGVGRMTGPGARLRHSRQNARQRMLFGAPDTIRTCDLCLRRATLGKLPVIIRNLAVQAPQRSNFHPPIT